MRINPISLSPSFTLPLDDRARMHVQVRGDLHASPWVSLHGGPGSGGGPGQWLPFDSQRTRVMIPDQRGAGRSRPRGALRGNDLTHLVADMERLRAHLNLKHWGVFGGSWGATLALAYTAKHPERVTHLVLRGSFDGRNATVKRLFTRRSPCPARCGTDWTQTRQTTGPNWHKLLRLLHFGALTVAQRRVITAWQQRERQAILQGLRRSLHTTSKPADRQAIAQQLRALRQTMRQSRHQAPRRHAVWRGWRDTYRIQAHYFAHACFLRPGQWAHTLQTIAKHGVPIDVVHGCYDQVCPPTIAQDLERHFGQTCIHWTHAGHLGTEPSNLAVLRQLLNEPARNFSPKHCRERRR